MKLTLRTQSAAQPADLLPALWTVLPALLTMLALAGGARADAAAPADAPNAAPRADTVITNARIYTLDPQRPWAEAAAIRDGRFTLVGSVEQVMAAAGEGTRSVDLGGRMVMPGINDAHAHPFQGGLKSLFHCTFPFTAEPAAVAEVLRRCIAENPQAQWIEGGQWTSDFFRNHAIESPREWLDAISEDVAIFLHDDATHNGWVNSRALALAGITADTPDPEGGRIVRDANGEPNGLLYETGRGAVLDIRPEWSPEQYRAAIEYAIGQANRFGITGLNEARIERPVLEAYRLLDQSGELTVHLTANQQTPRGFRDTPLDVAGHEALRDAFDGGHLNVRHIKIFLDGVPTASRTALMLKEYLTDDDHPEPTRGFLLVDAEVLKKDLIALDRAGFTVRMHAAGDGSVRVALDAIAAAREANGASGQRHNLAHAGYVDPADLPRFAALNATADMSPYLWYPSPIMDSLIGAIGERGRRYYPVRALLDSGADVLMGSDWPSAAIDLNPWGAIEALVTRRDPGGAGPQSLWPEQAISLAEALHIATVGGARGLGIEDNSGAIAAGMSADFIVLDRHLFEAPVEAVSDTVVEETWFEGRRVYPQ
jgi:predicted amidohydrolase YtcJ